MHTWNSPTGSLNLGRFPYDGLDPALFAWNGADSLLAAHLADLARVHGAAESNGLRVLILNDRFGTLACAALKAGCSVHWQSDSFLAKLACQRNLTENCLDGAAISYFDSLSGLDLGSWQPDLVLIYLPKSHLLLEYQLRVLAKSLPAGIPVCAGGMTRDVHTATIKLFEKILGPSHTSLAAHKARLIHSALANDNGIATRDSAVWSGDLIWPRASPLVETGLPELTVRNHAGVFSAGGHDRGSLFLLHWLAANLPAEGIQEIVDCGCGNGLLSLVAARLYPKARLVCTDESWMAIASTRAGFESNGMAGRAEFVWTDCLEGVTVASADLVLCNPPFHHLHTQTLAIALRMFGQAKACLRPTGRLVVVANRHLGYRRHLEALFPHVRQVAENATYQVILAYLA